MAKQLLKQFGVMSLSRLSAIAIFIWIMLLMYISTVLVKVQYTQSGGSDGGQEYQTREATALEALERIKKASLDIEALKKQNEELKQILYDSSNQMAQNLGGKPSKRQQALLDRASMERQAFMTPPRVGHMSADHENLRRSIENGIQEFWYRLRAEMSKVKDLASSTAASDPVRESIQNSLDDLREQHRTLLADVQRLARVDQGTLWRHQRLANISGIVFKRLEYLQNDQNCSEHRKLLCNLNKGCGFGCQIHHAAYCLMMAYGTERTLYLDTSTWRYSKTKSWNHYFQPVTGQNCAGQLSEQDKENAVLWSDVTQTDPVVNVPILDGLRNPPPFLPLSFPEEFSKDLLHLHGAPPVWWVAQFVAYLMRPSANFYPELKDAEANIGIGKAPIVGVHIRRTDKVGAEAAFHSVQEYMTWVEEWFLTQELVAGKPLKRRAYVATDDLDVLGEAQNLYPEYEILGDRSIAETAQLNRRYTDSSLRGVLLDIHLLSKCDYLVCTFSSQVCRVAYELMQQWRGDAASAFHSLDDIYYFGGQQGHEQYAIYPHNPRASSGQPDNPKQHELQLQVNDTVGVAGNHWDGFSKGKQSRTGRIALYPSYKVREKWRIAKMPEYKHLN